MTMTDDEVFWELIDELRAEDPRIEEGTIMGGRCARVAGEFLALVDFKDSGMVVKLPRARVDELIARGTGRGRRSATSCPDEPPEGGSLLFSGRSPAAFLEGMQMTTDHRETTPFDEQTALLMSGCEFGDAELEHAMRRRLRERLVQAHDEGRPLRVYAGYDPSAPDLHLGHSITLRKLRQFQQLGHDVVVVIGTVTAMVGDTSDRASGRPRKTLEEVEAAAATYGEQVALILDPALTIVAKNSDWLGELRLAQVLDLAAEFTVQQFLARDNYRRRLERGEPVGLHEFFYALLQGYDAVHLHADVQLGATEQLFNILAGSKLQEAADQRPCAALTFPILVGTDGTERMSKSRGNYIGLSEAPQEQFGKAMSISDETMLQWVGLITEWGPSEILRFRDDVTSGRLHPMEAKKRLAGHIVAMYHGDDASRVAQEHFEQVHQRRSEPDVMTELVLAGPTPLVDFIVQAGAAASRSAARRLIDGGGVSIDGERISVVDRLVTPPATVKVGSRRFYRAIPG